MKCARCQHENRPGAKFCEECAAPLASVCANCGAPLSVTAKFCSECAHPAGRDAPAASPRFGAPEVYTPKHLAEKILTSKAAIEGERKQVTVLFADLKGSMELLADRDPEEARKLLDPVLERMMQAVHQYEGTVNQVMGDGIMALFGAPLAHEDHAVRACYAALRMQESVKRYAEGVFRSFGVPVQIRVGLNSGEVVVRAIGSDLHMDYTAVGQSTHLAARMEQMAQPGTILLTPETLALAEGFVQVASRGPVPVKGLPAPIEIFELTGASPVRSRLQAAASRGLTRFVGREAEIALLRQALGRAAEGHGQLVAAVGEPGVGKSRLVWEFTHSHRSQGWLVLEAASVSYGKATPYFPVIELLRSYFAIEPRDDARKMREKVTGKLLSLDRALEPSLAVFLSLLDVPVEDLEWMRLEPPQRRRQTLEALRRLLLRESQVQPVLLVVEDLHWIDGETQAWLDLLVESLPTARLLLVVNYRPEYGHGWGRKTYYQQLRLDTLPAASAGELLVALLGTGPGLEDLERLLIERAQGNPFFLEESVRALVETRALAGERGAYRLAWPIKHLQLPATTQAILAARIDRLPPGDKRLLQAAAVVGKDAPSPLLLAIAEEAEDSVRQALARLQAAEFLYEARLFPELEYTFKHALTHEVVYGGLLQDRRIALHARILEVMEQLYADHLDEHVERLAHHALRGEVREKAVDYLRQAGGKAAARGALADAVVYVEHALGVLERVERTPASLVEAIDLHLMARNALYAVGEHERVLPHLEAAERLAGETGDLPRLARVLRYVGTHFFFTGDYSRAVEAGQRAVRIAESSGDTDLQLETRLGLAIVDFPRGEYRAATESLCRLVSDMGDDGPAPRFFGINLMSSTALDFLALVLAERGEFDEATAAAQEALRRADAHDPRYGRPIAWYAAGYVHTRRGDLAQATKLLELAVDGLRAVSVNIVIPAATAMLGLAHSLAGRDTGAIALLEEAVAHAHWSWIHSQPLACLAEAHVLGGRLDAAELHASRALELARMRGERGIEAWALRLLGEVAARSDSARPTAEEHYREALVMAGELEMRPLTAHCHFGLGKVYRRIGKQHEAHAHFNTALTMYREMNMRLWLEQAEAEMRTLA